MALEHLYWYLNLYLYLYPYLYLHSSLWRLYRVWSELRVVIGGGWGGFIGPLQAQATISAPCRQATVRGMAGHILRCTLLTVHIHMLQCPFEPCRAIARSLLKNCVDTLLVEEHCSDESLSSG